MFKKGIKQLKGPDLTPEEAILLGREEREKLGYCMCGKRGKPRIDNGLSCGVQCDECLDSMVSECRSRSW